jgi:hypothetical protein
MEGNMRERLGPAARFVSGSGMQARGPVGNWPDPL